MTVAHVNGDAADHALDRLHQLSVAGSVRVAVHGEHRSDQRELVENLVAPHVTRVEDELHPRERLVHLRAEEPVRVGDQPDALQRMKLTVPREASSIASRMASRVLILSPPFADSSI